MALLFVLAGLGGGIGGFQSNASAGDAGEVSSAPSTSTSTSTSTSASKTAAVAEFQQEVRPLLETFCYDCHGDGANKGGVAFDELKPDTSVLERRDLWWKALKNVRAGLMPPQKKPQPTDDQKQRLAEWIKGAVFGIDPQNLDPGRVTVRRLNRAEYRNTIRDLLGVDFNAEAEFPPDDTGHGFDNIGDVLNLPTMLLEKYLEAAKTIVAKGVPAASRVPAEQVISGRQFRRASTESRPETNSGPLSLSYYEQGTATNLLVTEHGGHYRVLVDLTANEKFVDGQFDYNKCRLRFRVGDQELFRHDYTREGGKAFHYEVERDWAPGAHVLAFDLEPLTPDEKQVRSLTLRIDSVTVRGPGDERYWVAPKNYDRFFPRAVPRGTAARREYAREVLERFATRAYRRPVDAKTLDRLVGLAESTYRQRGKTFEAGIGQAMVGVLASPRFLFREETPEALGPGQIYPFVDEYALASRLSYFFWSSMPDDELFGLAAQGKLRTNLAAQARRLLADPRSDALVRNFTGQWLQARDIETVPIDARVVLGREAPMSSDFERRRARFRQLREKPEESLTKEELAELEQLRATLFRRNGRLRAELTGELRRDMRQETEKVFNYVVRGDRSLLELLDSDYTFLNERLAKHYGMSNIVGEAMQRVTLPEDSPRGGILTEGTVLAVTSNPTRTSPVKRGLFILENILGTPPPPPPPDIPPLEDAVKDMKDHTPTLRETLALHREKPLCASCHNRMDPLGLAFEHFNAMGMWRDKERDQPIDATGKLLSGEEFGSVKELKRILVERHSVEFYRTLTEKLLIYALGRGLDYTDVGTVDTIVERLVKTQGRPSALLLGIVESAPFQKTRISNSPEPVRTAKLPEERAEAQVRP